MGSNNCVVSERCFTDGNWTMKIISGFEGRITSSAVLDLTKFVLVSVEGVYVFDLTKGLDSYDTKVITSDGLSCDGFAFDSKRMNLYLHSSSGEVRKTNIDGKSLVNSDTSDVYIDGNCESIFYHKDSDSLLTLDSIGVWSFDLVKGERTLLYKVYILTFFSNFHHIYSLGEQKHS